MLWLSFIVRVRKSNNKLIQVTLEDMMEQSPFVNTLYILDDIFSLFVKIIFKNFCDDSQRLPLLSIY